MSWLVQNRDVLLAYRHGERWALEAVYRHYLADLRRYVSLGFSFTSSGRQCRFRGYDSPIEVEDTLQEVFVRVLSEPARLQYDGLRPFKNYLFTIARNIVLRDLSRATRLVYLEETSGPASVEQSTAARAESPPETPEQSAVDRQLQTLVEEFVANLSHHDRKVYEIRFSQQKTQQQVAQQMHLTKAKVKTCEQRIRSRFLKFMSQHGWSFDNLPTSDSATAGAALPLLGPSWHPYGERLRS